MSVFDINGLKLSIMQCYFFILIFLLCSFNLLAQSDTIDKKTMQGEKGEGISNKQISQSNNPLANLNSLNFNNYYSPKIQGTTETSNTLYLRGVVVSGRQIIRGTMPILTTPSINGYKSGLGDFNIFDAIKLTGDSAKTEFGIGPMAVIPTATNKILGAGKWQLGGAAVIIHPFKGGHLLGSLITYQHSIAGEDSRPATSILTFQPVLTLNMGKGIYGRSSGAAWIFDFENHNTLIPLGIGIGKILKAGKTVVNMFVEPEFTIYSEGRTQPAYQVLFGMNFQWFKDK